MNENSGWPTRMGNNQRQGFSSESCEPPLTLAWKYWLGEYIWSGPVIEGETVYCTGSRMIALDLKSGQLLWENPEVRSIGYVSASVGQEALYICALDGLYALDKRTGKVIYQVAAKTLNSSACFDGHSVYFYGKREEAYYLFALEAETGKEIWKIRGERGLHTTPSLFDHLLFWGNGPVLQAIDRLAGTLKWSQNLGGGKVRDTTAVWDQKVFVSIEDHALLALDAQTGAAIWRFDYNDASHCSPCLNVDRQHIFVASQKLHALEASTGNVLWHSENIGFAESNPIAVGDLLFIGGGLYRCIYCFNQTTGMKLWEFPTGDLVFSTPAFANGCLVIGSHDGYLYCFRG